MSHPYLPATEGQPSSTPLSATRVWAARILAVLADLLQLALFPIFGEGFASLANIMLDCILAVVLCFLVGWHIVFLPTFIVEQLPLLDLAPTWTIAVFIATYGRSRQQSAHAEQTPKLDAKGRPV
ncbi:MAG: hypothetical protein ABSE73_22140 [Planctomycetota bacterium]